MWWWKEMIVVECVANLWLIASIIDEMVAFVKRAADLGAMSLRHGGLGGERNLAATI